jgi:tetratricopeptide (TPR) repeat protein
MVASHFHGQITSMTSLKHPSSFIQAQAAQRAGRDTEAANILREALRRDQSHAPSFHMLGVIEVRQGRLEVALKCFEAAVDIDPRNAGYLMARANVIASMGNPADAVAAYDLALTIDPKLAEAHSNRGQALRLLGRRSEAIDCFRRAISIKADFIDARFALGDCFVESGDFESAITAYTQTLLLNPAHIPALLNRGQCQLFKRRWAKAEADFKQVLELIPEHAVAQGKRAECLLEMDKYSLALTAAERATALQPDRPEWQVMKGRALHGLKRFAEALAVFEHAATLPGADANSLIALGSTNMELQRYDKALEYFDRGIRLSPTIPSWYYNRGLTLSRLQRLEEAIANYDEAIARDPLYAGAYWNSALCHLALGDPKGWELYEWRWKLEKGGPDKSAQPSFLPLWQGFESIEGKHILLTGEQGLGDVIMFSRYAELVRARGARVSLAVAKPLGRLLQSIDGLETVYAGLLSNSVSDVDYYCPLLSLPRIFRTTIDSIPSGSKPYISADPDLIVRWREILGKSVNAGTHARIGLMWSGRLVEALGVRSMSLETLLDLMDPRLQFISLQKDLPDSDIALLSERGVLHYGAEQQDFADAAAIVELIDLVITIDTSIAHLAGAMGKETWILLKYDAEWRWLQDRNDSPWYPNVRLFRQPKHGDWESVIADVKQALLERF